MRSFVAAFVMNALQEYRRKRRLDQTPEPAGDTAPRPFGGHRFVVQKHDAARLHYDFRLEIDGVLKSWAVPKGPSMNPADKRLAIQTEDHPLEYATFEGVIPDGHYGAGPVMVWDAGTFETEGTLAPRQQLERGEIKFVLHGHKLRGSWTLVKLRQAAEKGKGNAWLLIKHRDAAADPHWNIEEHDGSVLSGRRMKEIEEGVSPSDAPPAATLRPAGLQGARRAAMLERVEPMLATAFDKPFSHPDWLFEIKWDGVRALAWVDEGKLRLQARTGRSITSYYPELAELPQHVLASKAILDGEIVVLDEQGRSDFERLQQRMNVDRPPAALQRQAPVVYYLFDLLYCDGYDLRQASLIERKRLLRALLEPGGSFRYADHVEEKGRELFELARKQGLEGIIAKHARSPYKSGRTNSWLKLKVVNDLDAVVGGWTAPRGSREFFGALLVGLYDDQGRLRLVGGVGTGFNGQSQKQLHDELQRLSSPRCPFDPVPATREKAFWVKPKLVVRVKYSNWTRERHLRAPVFLGLRPDRNPKDCRFDTQAPSPHKANADPPPAPPGPVLASRVLRRENDIARELKEGRTDNLTLELEGKQLQLTNLNKMYFPESGYTKRDLLNFYYLHAKYILPFLRERPLVLRRYPDGIHGPSFFQKDAPESIPPWIPTVEIESEEKRASGSPRTIRYFLANDRTDLLYLTNLGCIDHNPWSSRASDLEHPDYLFFDLDPSAGTKFDVVVQIGRAVLRQLRALGLEVFIKTSGATGLHFYVPVAPGYSYQQVRTFAEIVGRSVAHEEPQKVTLERSVSKRKPGTVLIDVAQNALGRPLASVYSVRAFPGAPVSTPIRPAELKVTLRPERFNIQTVRGRLARLGDLWAPFWDRRQQLEDALERLMAWRAKTNLR